MARAGHGSALYGQPVGTDIMVCPLGGFRCIFPLFDWARLIRSRLIPIDIHSKNFLLQNKALQKQEALEIRMSFLVLKKVAEIFTHCEEEKAST